MNKNLQYWVALNLVLSEKLNFARKIITHFSSVTDIFEAGIQDLLAIGIDKKHSESIKSPKILDQASREIDRLTKKKYTILTLDDRNYPDYLRETFDPPLVLYCAGKTELLKGPAVSIVGARRPTPYGRAVAERLSQDLASRGIIIVSGLAYGIDSIAHWGALKGGKTIAVLGSGLEYIYPKENLKLFEKIIETGAVVSEYPHNAPPLASHFPLRNRIISGLSLALVVVEGTKKSGSLISARLALEQNREVMAVPGNITSKLSQGTNWLIKTGAKLIENWEDIAEEFPSPLKDNLLSQKEDKKDIPSMTPKEKMLFELLSPDSETHIDKLVDKSDLSVSEILSILLNLELNGLISQSPGKYFQRKL